MGEPDRPAGGRARIGVDDLGLLTTPLALANTHGVGVIRDVLAQSISALSTHYSALRSGTALNWCIVSVMAVSTGRRSIELAPTKPTAPQRAST